MSMKIVLFCLAYCFVAAIAKNVDSDDVAWKEYKKKFNKAYEPEEELNRKEIFKQNVEKINHHNDRFDRKEFSYKLGINQFTDMSEDEILSLRDASYFAIYDNNFPSKYDSEINNVEIPLDFDWRKEGAVSEVRDSGDSCKSDWAFATVGALEGQLYKKSKTLTQLSEQELIECSGKVGNNGCQGGSVQNAINYVKEHGISTEETYPLSAKENKCHRELQQVGIPENETIDCKPIKSEDENDMKNRLCTVGPLIAQIHASPKFYQYKEGIFTGEDCDDTKVHYNVLVVGYNASDDSNKFWIVKNWHGKSWGEDGYMRIAFSTCGIAVKPVYINITSEIK